MRHILATTLLLLAASFAIADEEITYEIEGLSKPVEILIDEWGIAHIYAEEHYDAFFAQGFNAARDRLWQIDLWRRRGLGELSSILGKNFLEQDKAARLFLYRGDMFHEWLAYGSDAKKISQSFTAGINAFVKLTETNADLLPEEFKLLDYKPAYWLPSDVVRIRSNGLWRNVVNEAARAQIVCKHGLDVDAKRFKLEPEWTTSIPDGLDPCKIPEDATHLYRLAKAPVDFGRADQFSDIDMTSIKPSTYEASLLALRERDLGAGSNNWVVSPDRTTTGRPILANDPHRGHAVPSLRYITHLVAPGLNVIGAGEPALPGISIGHNERIAFGLTIFSIDQEDLMVYEINDGKYRYKGEFRPLERIVETFEVRNGPSVESELQFTVHGPVIYQDEDTLLAVQAAWLEPGMAPYFGSVEYMRATGWNQFLAALNRWGAPSENQVYADVDGNIGYKPAGLTPIRKNYDGLLPVPGDGRYEWQGFYDMDELPVQFNPKRGWAGTANAMSLPDGYPYEEKLIGFEWAYPWRISRIAEVLDNDKKHSMKDSINLQRDYLSIPARTVLQGLDTEALPFPANELFTGWDYKLEKQSAAAALFEVWFSRFLNKAVMSKALKLEDLSSIGTLHNNRVVQFLGEMPAIERQKLASKSLTLAIAEANKLMGDQYKKWQWQTLHKIQFKHPLLDYLTDDQKKSFSMPLVTRGGSGDTTNSTRYRSDFTIVSGASWRMVLDVGNWDNAFMTNSPGQSGIPGNKHYADLLKPWADDETLPLVYSRKKVEKHTESVIQLKPRTKPKK